MCAAEERVKKGMRRQIQTRQGALRPFRFLKKAEGRKSIQIISWNDKYSLDEVKKPSSIELKRHSGPFSQ
jgi:hypothetical protein